MVNKAQIAILICCGAVVLCACAPASPSEAPLPAPSQVSPLASPLQTPGPDSPLAPSDSPLSQLDLLYHGPAGGNFQVFRRPPGQPPRQLTLSGISNAEPRWSPDGQTIAYTANLAEGRYELYLMNADGGNPRRLLKQNFAYNWGASWSPDGAQILFASNQSGMSQLYVVGLDGESPRQLTFEGNNFLGVWSPDGKRIAFTSDRSGSGDNEIYVMNADGSQVEQLTDNEVDDAAPAWSPDGRYLAYHSYEQGVFNIYLYEFATRRARALTREALATRFPTWSPDGRYVLCGQQLGEKEFQGLVIRVADGQIVERLPGAAALHARASAP